MVMTLFACVITDGFFHSVSFSGPGLAEAFAAPEGSLEKLIEHVIDFSADTHDRLHPQFFEEPGGSRPHAAGQDTTHASFMEESRDEARLMTGVRDGLRVPDSAVFDLDNRKGRTSPEMG